jgi:hypothetical protein
MTNSLRAPDVQNVEHAYANRGGTTRHQPDYGSLTRGNRGSDGLRQGAAAGLNDGMDSEHTGEEQRPVQLGIVGNSFHKIKYGSKSGK